MTGDNNPMFKCSNHFWSRQDLVFLFSKNHALKNLFIFLTGIGISCGAYASDDTHLYWGDVHLHSNYSVDAYMTGNTSVTPDLAYRYARGIPILHPSLHTKVKIRRPLDFRDRSRNQSRYGCHAGRQG